MRQTVNVIIENDGYLIRKHDDSEKYIKVMPQGIRRIPCIPFYQSAWVKMGNDVRPAVSEIVEKVSLLYGPVAKCNLMIAYPADATQADIIIIRETFEVAGFKKIKMMSKTELVAAMKICDYIAISASERLLILEWYRDGVVAEGKYYNKAAVSKKKLLSDVESFKARMDSPIGIYVFDGCGELSGLYDFGMVISSDKMVELLDIMSDVHYKKMSLDDIIGKSDSDAFRQEGKSSQVEGVEVVFDDENVESNQNQ